MTQRGTLFMPDLNTAQPLKHTRVQESKSAGLNTKRRSTDTHIRTTDCFFADNTNSEGKRKTKASTAFQSRACLQYLAKTNRSR